MTTFAGGVHQRIYSSLASGDVNELSWNPRYTLTLETGSPMVSNPASGVEASADGYRAYWDPVGYVNYARAALVCRHATGETTGQASPPTYWGTVDGTPLPEPALVLGLFVGGLFVSLGARRRARSR